MVKVICVPTALCLMLVWGLYAFVPMILSDSHCYGTKEYNPFAGKYEVKVSTEPWPLEEDSNVDISKSFHLWFIWGFI